MINTYRLWKWKREEERVREKQVLGGFEELGSDKTCLSLTAAFFMQ